MTQPPVPHRFLNRVQSNLPRLILRLGVSTFHSQTMPMVETIVPASMAAPMYSILGVKRQNRQTTRPTRVSVSNAATRFCRSSRLRQNEEIPNGVLTWFNRNAATAPANNHRV